MTIDSLMSLHPWCIGTMHEKVYSSTTMLCAKKSVILYWRWPLPAVECLCNGQVVRCLSACLSVCPCVMSTAAALTHICHRRQSAAVSTQRQCCNPRRKDAGFFIEWLSKLTHSNDFWDTLNPEKIGINILRKCALLTCKMWPLSLICLTCLWQTTHHCTACTSCN